MFRKILKESRVILASVAVLTLVATPAFAADQILGNWTSQAGETVAISDCGGAYCFLVKTGEHAGKPIGRLEGADGTYEGKITDPADDKEYSGFAKINNGRMELKGCALVIFCKTQIWHHQ